MIRGKVIGLVLGLVAGGLLAWVFDAAAEQEVGGEELIEQYDRFIEIVRIVQKQYVRDVDPKKMFKDAINGMLGGLDPFSTYVPEDEIDEFNKMTHGKFGGIGIQIGMRRGMLTVISPLEDTPAYRAGILAGDVILAIEGKSTDGITLNDAVKVLTGKPGTKVTITVRHLTGETEDITITRAMIEVRTVKGFRRGEDEQWVWMLEADKKIGYVRVSGFVDNTVEELRGALEAMLEDGLKALVLDLRFNPGGQLPVALKMSDLFLDEGVIVQTRGRITPHWEATATKEGTLPYFPMVVLVNQFSASASEIVAGALQDHSRAIILGERTFGKGSVQNVIPLEGERAALKLTTSKYYTPSGRNIQHDEEMTDEDEWGVMPDIVVPVDAKEYVRVVRARQEAEIIHDNEGDGADEKEPAAEEPQPGAGEDEQEDEPPVEEMEPPAPEAVPPERETREVDPLAGDRQLQRALDVLRSMEVIENYLKKAA
ncbi:MAG TPA: S41 family peptidase [Phycisphaerae bacterium]|nr:S41 family peptidase [Phycisphaerae bacterium]